MTAPSQPPKFARNLMKFFRNFGLARGLVRRGERPSGGAPQQPLVLYSLEGCGHCRRVRETLTELDLDYLHQSCPFGSERNRAALRHRGGRAQVPYLIDPNTGVELYESRAIVDYLEQRYGAPSEATPQAALPAPAPAPAPAAAPR